MLTLIMNSGPFGIFSLIIGLTGLALVLADALTQGRLSLHRAAGAAAAAAFLVGIIGTALGLYVAAQSVTSAEAASQATMWYAGMGTAMTTTVVGSAAALINLLAITALGTFKSRPGAQPA